MGGYAHTLSTAKNASCYGNRDDREGQMEKALVGCSSLSEFIVSVRTWEVSNDVGFMLFEV